MPREVVERMVAKMEEEQKKYKFPSCAQCEHAVLVPLKFCMRRKTKLISEFKDYYELGLKFEGWNAGKRTEECKGFKEGEPLIILAKKEMRMPEFMEYLTQQKKKKD